MTKAKPSSCEGTIGVTDKLTGTVYVGAVGSEDQHTAATLSILRIHRRDGDSAPHYATPTKGYEGRSAHVAAFLESAHAFILMLDMDMLHPPDLLERLRAHGLAYVSALYFRRQQLPVTPVWFEAIPFDQWPAKPWSGPIEKGRLHELGASGWGAVLIHRSVFEGVRPLLKGEPFVVEDDMDVWPYDLAAVLRGQEQLRPLRARKDDLVGSDIRFGWFARQAGFTLLGDPDAECGHLFHVFVDSAEHDPAAVAEAMAAYPEKAAAHRAKAAEVLGISTEMAGVRREGDDGHVP